MEQNVAKIIEKNINDDEVNIGRSVSFGQGIEEYTIIEFFSKNNSGFIVMDNNFNVLYKVIKSENTLTINNCVEATTDILKTDNNISFDVFKWVNEIRENPIETNNRKFWGWSCGDSWTLPNGQCYANCCYYVFWGQVYCNVYGCGGLPGNQQT